MVHIVVLEDNQKLAAHYGRIISSHCESHSIRYALSLLTTRDEIDLFVEHPECVDVLFCDIDLGSGLNGFQIACRIKAVVPDAYVVFISGHLEFLLQAFRLHVYDFLPKPVSASALVRCLEDIRADMERRRNADAAEAYTVEIKAGPLKRLVNCDDIILVEKAGNRLMLSTAEGIFSFYESLESFTSRIAYAPLIRVHKGYVINRRHIKAIDTRQKIIFMTNGSTAPIGDRYKDNLNL